MLLKRTSLKGRLVVVILLTSFICVSLTTVAITYFGIENIRGKMAGDINFTAKVLGERVATNIQFPGYEEDAKRSLESAPPNIRRICLYSRDGLYTFHMREDKKHLSCPPVEELALEVRKPKFTENSLLILREIKFKGKEVVGHIFVESDLGEIKSFINDQLLTAGFVVLGVSLLSYLIAVCLQGSISRPILHLVQTTRKVSDEKDYSIRANNFLQGEDVKRNEIAVLIEAFNQMLDEIEERRQLLLKNNQELIKARDAAESANRAKSQFLANISHELRTPLNAVIGFSDIIMQEMLGPVGNAKYTEYAKDINESGEHLLHIINDILDLSKAEAGKLLPVFREISVRKGVSECMNVIAERAKANGVALETNINNDIPPLVVDRVMFRRVMLHLLSNAAKFTNEGGTITVNVDVKKDTAGIDVFTVIVKDTGIGMSKSELELAFSSFTQVDSGLNRKYDGTGLGLPICKKFMELLGGSIRLESEAGKGTSAILTFYSNPQAV